LVFFFIFEDKFCMAKISKDKQEQRPLAEDFSEKKVRLLREPWTTEIAPGHRQMIEDALERTQDERGLQ
jgi:hypothetical protein